MNDNETMQTDSDIISEFEDLFGSETDSEETDDSIEDTGDDGEEIESDEDEDDEDEADETETEDESEEEDSDEEEEEETPQQKKQRDQAAKQKEAFYRMRTQNKAYEKLFTRLGKLFDLTDTGNPDDVVARIEQALTAKEAEKSNVPVEVMQRLQELEAIVNQKESNDRENRITDELANVGRRFNLDQEGMEDFLLELTEDGKNPLEVDVDLEAEYLKRHFDEILENARNEGVEQESKRKDKIKDKAPGSLPGKKDKSGSDNEIKTIADLNSFLDSL